MMKAKLILVEPIDRDPFYAVYFKLNPEAEDWNIAKVFSFRHGGEGIWKREKNFADAMELVKMIEESKGQTETIIYETGITGKTEQTGNDNL